MLFVVSLLTKFCVYAQAITLNADGPGNTYELINSVLAPGYDVVENSECVHPAFGRHITEVWDTDLSSYVFEFYSHVTPDNDRCIVFDRQRIEIKTYDQSPVNLIGTLGETITYKWRFKLATGFQPSSIVLQQNITANSLSVDVSALKAGIYVIQISGENNEVISKTFLKE